MDFLETITCRRCDQVFFVCHRCCRGQAYYQQSCRDEARSEQVRRANQTYMATIKGQERRGAAVCAARARRGEGPVLREPYVNCAERTVTACRCDDSY